jgi:hypothetical protein
VSRITHSIFKRASKPSFIAQVAEAINGCSGENWAHPPKIDCFMLHCKLADNGRDGNTASQFRSDRKGTLGHMYFAQIYV